MKRLLMLTSILAFGCGCENPFVRNDEAGNCPPPLPREEQPGGRFDKQMETWLGPDRNFDPDLRPPFTIYPDPRMPVAPRAEDPSWKNR